jgi:aryl-alcohol dehydrogenase-like predicted oxidoreductase
MGCMAFSHGYGKIPDEAYSVETIRMAFDHGCTFFDTAEVYGPELKPEHRGHNERIVGRALEGMRDRAIIATKLFVETGEPQRDGSLAKTLKRHLAASLRNLRTDWVDLYYLHRINPDIPVEEVADAMGGLIREGLVKGWGLSMVNIELMERAQTVTSLAAVQNIYSMVERDSEAEIIPYCIENNIGFVPFSPIASGLLSGKITPQTQFERNDDVRNWVPQLSRRNIEGNLPIVEMLKTFADKKNATPAQISLAWMLHKYPNVVPIPGSKNKERIVENLDSANVILTDEEFLSLETELNGYTVYGHRGLGGF